MYRTGGSRIARPVSAYMTAPHTPAAVRTHKVTATGNLNTVQNLNQVKSQAFEHQRKPLGEAQQPMSPQNKRPTRVPVKVYKDEEASLYLASHKRHPVGDQENLHPELVKAKGQTPHRKAPITKTLRSAAVPLRDPSRSSNNLATSIRPGQGKIANKPIAHARLREILRPKTPTSNEVLNAEKSKEVLRGKFANAHGQLKPAELVFSQRRWSCFGGQRCFRKSIRRKCRKF